MRTVAILPVKSFGRAKQRLGSAFPDRPALAAAMVADVLEALGAGPEPRRRDRRHRRAVAAERRARPARDVVHDPVEAGQSAAVARGIDAALERGAERVLLVPGDCPALDPGEVERAARHTDAAS